MPNGNKICTKARKTQANRKQKAISIAKELLLPGQGAEFENVARLSRGERQPLLFSPYL